jgi:hypothetical protein
MADWSEAVSGKPGPCHYGCGKLADLTEPGRPWKAHKVCADGDVGAAGSVPLGTWVENDAHAEGGTYGCGTSVDAVLRGRVCAGNGGQLTCQLCPQSPTYWRAASP